MRDIPFVPRFYIDDIQFCKTSGIGLHEIAQDIEIESNQGNFTLDSFIDETNIDKLFDLNPSNYHTIDWSTGINEYATWGDLKQRIGFNTGSHTVGDLERKRYIAVLGHNFKQANIRWGFMYSRISEENPPYNDFQDMFVGNEWTEIINATGYSDYISSPYNGFSMVEMTGLPNSDTQAKRLTFFMTQDDQSTRVNETALGAISYGTIFEMPFSSDLQLNISYEYGVQSKESISGSSYNNVSWWQKPIWASESAWELNDISTAGDTYLFDPSDEEFDIVHPYVKQRKSGRRVYDLTFSFISADDAFATNPNASAVAMEPNQFEGDTTDTLTDVTYDGTSVQILANNGFCNNLNLLNDHSIFARLCHATCGFANTFIFQPDKTYAKPDGFMLAKIDNKNLKLEQIGVNLFRCKMKIKEVW